MKTKLSIDNPNTQKPNNATPGGRLRKTATALIAAGVITGMSLPVAANKYRDYNNSAYDYAKVIDAVPVIETYEVNRPVEKCWNEQVRPRDSRHDYRDNRKHSSRTPEVLGAIIGGVIGNQFGHGDGRKIATVAGAVLGSSVGRDVKYNNRRNRSHGHDHYEPGRYEESRYETVQRCELTDSYVTEERVVGFDVSYKYRGNVFHTQMPEEPGKKIKVKVTVNPV